MRHINPYLSGLSPDDDVRLEQLVSGFEDAWQQGERPNLEAVLPQAPELHSALLIELAITDLEYRLRAGDVVTAADYAARFPEFQRDKASARALFEAETRLRVEHFGTCNSPGGEHGKASDGKSLARYVLQRKLGTGAHGTVFLAHDIELDRLVAIKLPRQDLLPSVEDRERFLREARHAARLQHESIVSLHDWGISDDNSYLVMEYVAGPTLAELLVTDRPAPEESAALVAQLASALQHAHQRGVIHRDLKPANVILVSRQPLSGKIADFGLAQQLDSESRAPTDGYLVGTPAYLPPEIVRGQCDRTGTTSDIYSLGAVLYELLTGVPPFQGHVKSVLRQVVQDEPLPPRQRNGAIPRDLEGICLKALSKDTDQRYATAEFFAEDLRRFLRGEPVTARPLGIIKFGRNWSRRHPVVAGLSASLCVVAVVGTAAVLTLWRLAESRRRSAENHLVVALSALNDYTGLSDAEVQPRNRGADQRVSVAKALRYYEYLIENRPHDWTIYAPLAQLYYAQGVYASQGGHSDEAVSHWLRALSYWELADHQQQPTALQRWGLGQTCLSLADEMQRRQELARCRLYSERAASALGDACAADPDNGHILTSYIRATRFLTQFHQQQGDSQAVQRVAAANAAVLVELWRTHPSATIAAEIVAAAGSSVPSDVPTSDIADVEATEAARTQQWLQLILPDNLLSSHYCQLETWRGMRLAEACYRAGRIAQSLTAFEQVRACADESRQAELKNVRSWIPGSSRWNDDCQNPVH